MMNVEQSPRAPHSGRPRRFEALRKLATTSRYFRGEEICSQGEPADRWFWIVAGSARRSVIRPDGRRQIIDLLLPGNCFGFTNAASFDDTIEAAVADTYVASCDRRGAEQIAESNSELAREVREAVIEAMSRLQAQLFIVSHVTAVEKVGAYLLELSARTSNQSSRSLVLPMSRYDIADYLGLSAETVSRSLTHLKEKGAIKLAGPRLVRIMDPAGLGRNSGSTHEVAFRKRSSFVDVVAPLASLPNHSPDPDVNSEPLRP